MPVAVESLPAALGSRLDETSHRQLAETPRAGRLEVLARLLGVTEDKALAELAAASGLPVVPAPQAAEALLDLLPARLAHDFQAIPLAVPDPGPEELALVTSWPPGPDLAAWIATFTPRRLRWHLAEAGQVRQLIAAHYGVGAGSLEGDAAPELAPVTASDLDADADAAVVRFVTDILNQAVADGATDVHFEPQEGQLAIRCRVDGLLVAMPVPDNLLRYQDAIISRLKIMARLNISERRLPQDGRINFKTAGGSLDIRVSTIPTIYAESVSLRLLNQRREAYSMDRLGLNAEEQRQIGHVLDFPHGLVLVTGPTGSGKSTSLNAFLRKLNAPELRIVTIEDPIEYEVPGANQMQVRPEIGLTFADALRHVLRQDPDVMMVGEIRDRETADIAIRASLTGHLVFSTLHTNDAAGAITRLVDMGIEPFLVASAVELVIAQRLVRRLCPDCAGQAPVETAGLRATLSALGLNPDDAAGVTTLPAARGCQRCRGTGFRGRVGIFELFRPRELHDLIINRESTRQLARAARGKGMRTLAQSGWEKVRSGQTTLDELLRVISLGEA
ncbi:MAG TPA: GspE/PulE family protein [Lacunisphaera sp.]|nr:GspE/PulE family protein [Lacunisphaera sp.]